jgi:hypothetical protein
MLYPSAFHRNARATKRDSHASVVSRNGGQKHGDRPISSGGSLRPLSTRDVSSALASARILKKISKSSLYSDLV